MRRGVARRAGLLAGALLTQAAYGVLSVVVTRWGFRAWPQGSYTWVPGILAVGALAVLVGIGWYLGARGAPFAAIVAAWYAGRVAGALAASLVTGGGLDASLLSRASFGLVTMDAGRVVLGAPDVAPFVVSLAVLGAVYWQARRRHAARLP